MSSFTSRGRPWPAAVAASADRRGPVRAARALGAALALAVLGLSLAAGAAQATTFPGTNGRITASGALNTHPLNTGSQLELFTMNSTYNANLAFDITTNNHDECQLTDNEDSDYNPRYSKDGTKVAFVRNGSIWTMQLDGPGRAPDPGSTDGTSPPNPCATPGPVYLDPVPGTQLPLTASVVDSYVGGWCTKTNTLTSTTEEWIVFQRGVGVATEVYKQQIDPTTRAPIGAPVPLNGPNTSNDSQPAVTPDCSKIAFHSNRGGAAAGNSASNIWVMGFDGEPPRPGATAAVNLTGSLKRSNNTTSEESAPSWSPDKTKIVFQGDMDTQIGTQHGRNMEIYRMDANGSSVTRLTNSDYSGGGGSLDLTGFDLVPSYSPDGSKICFHSGRAAEFRDTGAPGTGIVGQWEIYTADASGTNVNVQRKTRRAGNDERCGWQEDPTS